MPILGTGVIVPGGAPVTVTTEGNAGISVGVRGAKHRVHYKLGGTNIYQFGVGNEQSNLILEKASEVTINNLGNSDISYDVYV